ncbi:uncharacterized protein LOC130949807 [Arachis stenosperma]|uniref:uncharacterized protein LOC130949807 n=1 Tax=Arachis stenosperma TaxID=217475 RepID=UPI0025AC59A1|nr:uncharacterized protein LOC130949807 [Arachis stenosperma]
MSIPIGQGGPSNPDLSGRDSSDTSTPIEFQVGQQFQSKVEVVLSVQTYSIRRWIKYSMLELGHIKYYGKCNVKNLENVAIFSDHRKLVYHVICTFIFSMVRADTVVLIKILWVLGVQRIMSSSIVVLKMSLCKLETKLTSHQFISTSFSGHSHNVSRLSGIASHYLVSIGLTCTTNMGHVIPQLEILVISNRHNGIKAALEAPDGEWLLPSAYRAFYIWHLVTNFALSFKGKDARRFLMNTSYGKIEVDFDYWFDILRSEDLAIR